jgi:hypothetical protein
VRVARIGPDHLGPTIALLEELRVSLFGVRSRRVVEALAADGVSGRIDCRIAFDRARVHGVVMAAPASYWRSLPLRRPAIALAWLRSKIAPRAASRGAAAPPGTVRAVAPHTQAMLSGDAPQLTWQTPGEAWRVVFIGTAPEARGKGIARELYGEMMRDRSLVARVALDNAASLRLHRSLGWSLHRDGDVVLAVHVRTRPELSPAEQRLAG